MLEKKFDSKKCFISPCFDFHRKPETDDSPPFFQNFERGIYFGRRRSIEFRENNSESIQRMAAKIITKHFQGTTVIAFFTVSTSPALSVTLSLTSLMPSGSVISLVFPVRSNMPSLSRSQKYSFIVPSGS